MFYKEDFWAIFIVLSVIIAVVAGCTIPLLLTSQYINRTSCDEYSQMNPDRDIKYNVWTGCMIKTDNNLWISTSLLRENTK